MYSKADKPRVPYPAFESYVDSQSEDRIKRPQLGPDHTLAYVFTSGSTGLPKPCAVTAKRLEIALLLGGATGITKDDTIYTPLPFYHTAASLLALTWASHEGCIYAFARKFSASRFWDDCRKHNATVIQYIGELCRYLLAQPESVNDNRHSVVKAIGNGLRDDIWEEFKQRFNIKLVYEVYGATEGQVGLVNFYQKRGCVGRFSPIFQALKKSYMVKYDITNDLPVRDGHGRCIRVKVDEPGLLITEVPKDLKCYGGDPALSKGKLLHDVFKDGDCYFNSGDLLYADSDYYVYFSDRVGDTFRWKGENVSTTEVSNASSSLTWIDDECLPQMTS